jgi:phospholipase A1
VTNYRGLGKININGIDNTKKWWFELQLNPRKSFGNVNTTASISFKVSDSSNQYAFLRFQDGYGESLLDYNKYSISLQIGICIKSNFYSIY